MISTYIYSLEDEEKRQTVERIYDLHYKRMYVLANCILKNEHDALDAVQDAFYNITATYYRFTPLDTYDMAALVYIYTRNAALNIYNSTKRRAKFIESFDGSREDIFNAEDPGEDVAKLFADKELSLLLGDAIDQLDDMYRDIVILKYYYSLKNTEIARVVHVNVGKVNSRLFRARGMLKKILGDDAYERITR